MPSLITVPMHVQITSLLSAADQGLLIAGIPLAKLETIICE